MGKRGGACFAGAFFPRIVPPHAPKSLSPSQPPITGLPPRIPCNTYHPQLLMALPGTQILSAEQAVRCLISSLHLVPSVKPAKQPLPWPVRQNPPPLEMTHLLFVKSSTLGFRGNLFAHPCPSTELMNSGPVDLSGSRY